MSCVPGRTATGAISAAEKKRKKKYTPKQKKFLKLFVNNDFKDPAQCALDAGYTPSARYSIASELKEDIMNIAKDILVSSAPSAAMTLTGILGSDKPTLGSKDKLVAAKEILDRVGIVKEEKVEHDHKVSGGIFLLPTKQEVVDTTEAIEGEVA